MTRVRDAVAMARGGVSLVMAARLALWPPAHLRGLRYAGPVVPAKPKPWMDLAAAEREEGLLRVICPKDGTKTGMRQEGFDGGDPHVCGECGALLTKYGAFVRDGAGGGEER
jgi:hypothetical protein